MKVNELVEGRMPSSVIKMKEKLTAMAYENPAELKRRFEEIAARDGKTAKEVALSTQWRHGYGKDNMTGPYVKACEYS